jgi:ADP-heptose:LPS heptosyltransferase
MKILIIRFSSIGDIVLTTPVVRCLKKQLDAEIHFLTKDNFKSLLSHNPYIDKVHLYSNDIIPALKRESFDLIVDLHNNLRSAKIKISLEVKSIAFNKINIQKWLRVNTPLNLLPDLHLVDRYFLALKKIDVFDDGQGLDFFTDQEARDKALQITKGIGDYTVLSLGANYITKRIPYQKCLEIVEGIKSPVLLIGGKDVITEATKLNDALPNKIIDMCGKVNLQVSAQLIRLSTMVITGDTGMMHIAAAYQKQIFSLWGNTIPEFGMYPFYGAKNKDKNTNLEVKGLSCRPCSKLGYDSCPKEHFRCMMDIEINQLLKPFNLP